MAASLTDLLQKVFLLTSSVDALKSDIKRMDALLLSHHERIIRLEAGGDLIAEKAKNASLAAAVEVNAHLTAKIARLEISLNNSTLQSAQTVASLPNDRAKDR